MFIRSLFLLLFLTISSFVTAGNVKTFFHNDLLGSPLYTTNEFGDINWQEGYKPFGEKIYNSVEAEKNDIWYTGRAHDDRTGLTYMNARYYDPYIGRFMSVDPMEFKDSNSMLFNRYSYVSNNPYRYVDPTGEFIVPVVLGVVGFVALEVLFVQAFGGADCNGCANSVMNGIPGAAGAKAGTQFASQISKHSNKVAKNTKLGGMGQSVGSALNKSATPSGRPLSNHAAFDSLERHGFTSLQQVDDIISNATHRISQADGATAFVQKIGRGSRARFNIIVEGEEGVVTGMLKFTKQEVRNMARNQGWEGLPF